MTPAIKKSASLNTDINLMLLNKYYSEIVYNKNRRGLSTREASNLQVQSDAATIRNRFLGENVVLPALSAFYRNDLEPCEKIYKKK